jgi:hypothetical protein
VGEKVYCKTGVEYLASEEATPFVESLNEEYTIDLSTRAHWVFDKFQFYDFSKLKNYMQKYMSFNENTFNINLIQND